MKSYKLFIASSTAAKNIAHALWPELVKTAKDHNLELHVERWWENVCTPGVSTLQSLIRQCNDVHFAIILLTRDDFAKKRGQKELIPRDNCIYEAGLFTGSFGPDPERCFLLTSCDQKALPTDLLGLTTIKVPDSAPGELSAADRQEVNMAAKEVVNAIGRASIKPRGIVPLKSGRELIQWERLENEGHLKKNSQVLISSEQPVELNDAAFADRIQKNMRSGHIRYLYFFYADSAAANVIAELLTSLAIAGVRVSPGGEFDKIEAEKAKIVENLRTASRCLSIHFLAYKPSLQVCIHNAERADDATCYLRYSKGDEPQFIEWWNGREAKRYGDSLRRLCTKPSKRSDEMPIFRLTTEFGAEKCEEYFLTLFDELKKLFPESLWADVQKYCFGEAA